MADYWSPEGARERQEARKRSGNTVRKAEENTWNNFWGGVGNFFNDANNNAGKANRERLERKNYVNPKSAEPKTAVTPSSSKPAIKPRVPRDGRNTLRPGWDSYRQEREPASSTQSSLFDELLGKVTSDWSGPDKSKIDYSPLDAALNARIGALNGIRDKSQQNFDISDTNLESMHRGFQNHIQTEGAGNYNKIADTQKQNLTASNDIAQNNLQQIKADDMAKRQAMLQNLGIQAAGAQEDSSAQGLNQAIGSIESREQADLANADQDRASNLAYNQGIATSVGQQGVERRGDLAQQLQQILGRVDMASADAQSENAQQRYQLEQREGDRQYEQWQNQRGFLSDTLGMMQDDALERDKMAMEQSQADPREIPGVAGVGQNLLNSGFDIPEVQNAMSVLANITGSDEYFKQTNSMEGNDKVAVVQRLLMRNGVTDPALAFQTAQSVASLGTTSKYENLPY